METGAAKALGQEEGCIVLGKPVQTDRLGLSEGTRLPSGARLEAGTVLSGDVLSLGPKASQ